MPANPYQTYSETVTTKTAISDQISVLGPDEIPFITYLGGLNSSPDKFNLINWPSTQCVWFLDKLAGLSTGLQASVASDASTFAVTAGEGVYIRPGKVLLIDSEYFSVSSVATDTISVTSFWGSTRTTHASTSTVYLRTQADVEGSTDTISGFTTPTSAYNYTQIVRDVIVLSESELVQSRYGIDNRLQRELAKKMQEMPLMVEQAPFYNTRSAGSSTVPRTMGGLKTFISTNTQNLSSAAIDESTLLNTVQSAWTYGASPKLIMCGAWVKRKINSWFAPYVRTERSETRGGVQISTVESDFGNLDIMMHRYMLPTELYVLTPENLGFLTFRPWTKGAMEVDGDRVKWQIVGEFTFVALQDKTHAYIYGISTTS